MFPIIYNIYSVDGHLDINNYCCYALFVAAGTFLQIIKLRYFRSAAIFKSIGITYLSFVFGSVMTKLFVTSKNKTRIHQFTNQKCFLKAIRLRIDEIGSGLSTQQKILKVNLNSEFHRKRKNIQYALQKRKIIRQNNATFNMT